MCEVISPSDADKLAKLLGMLGSNQLGERASAAQKADEFVRGKGLTWFDVILPAPVAQEVAAPKEEAADDTPDIFDDINDPRVAIEVLFVWAETLSDWENDFLKSVTKFRQLSEKQIETIWEALEKARRYARKAANDKK